MLRRAVLKGKVSSTFQVPASGGVRFKVDGIEHREKVGRRGDAIKLYKIRKAGILRGVEMPANMKDKGVASGPKSRRQRPQLRSRRP